MTDPQRPNINGFIEVLLVLKIHIKLSNELRVVGLLTSQSTVALHTDQLTRVSCVVSNRVCSVAVQRDILGL